MDRRSIVQLRTATDLVTSRLAVDLPLRRAANAKRDPSRGGGPTEDLKSRRQTLGWSVEEVAGRCGIDGQLLTEWECGTASPRLDMVQRWAAALALDFRLVPTEGETPRGLKVDWRQHRVTVDGNPVRLTPMEWKALERLARVPGELVTHHALFHHLYGESEPYRAQSTAIRVLITKLRRLLPLQIDAKWGKGYLVGGLDASLPAPAGEACGAEGAAISPPAAAGRPRDPVALAAAMAPREPIPAPVRQDVVELDEPKMMRRALARPASRGRCRAEELGVIERFLAERGVTHCPDVATIQQSPLPTLVWDKTKRKWVRPSAD